MRMRARRQRKRALTLRHARRRRPGGWPDATTEPDRGPGPEAVFDRVTGPYSRRAALAMPGLCEHDEET